MKRFGWLLLFTVFLVISCASETLVRIEIANTSSANKENEIVSLNWRHVLTKFPQAKTDAFVVLNEKGKQVSYQLIYRGASEPQDLIFPVTVAGKSQVTYSIGKGKPEVFVKNTHGRSVPERKDDFAWENDRMAYRMYGPALASENPSNGVDIWLKRTDELIVDKFYHDELKNKLSYHVDHGQGLDCYKVAHTLGAGGIAPFVKDSLWVGGHYTEAVVLDSGVLRTSFVLHYDSILVDGRILKEKLIITLDAFSQLNKAELTFEGNQGNFPLAAGIWLHNKVENMKINKEAAYIAYGESAVSDAKLESGRNYVGVLFPGGMRDAYRHNVHLLGVADYQKGTTFVYYFGAGWNKWGFLSDEDWFAYMDRFATSLKNPLKIVIK